MSNKNPSPATRFKPGQSGNPGGKPGGYKGFAAAIRRETRNGEEMLEMLLSIMRGTVDTGATTAERMQAVRMLLDRGIGKVPERQELEIINPQKQIIDVGAYTDEQLRVMADAVDVLTAPQLPPKPLEDE